MIASLGPRSVRVSVQLGIELCDVVASWARISNGMIFSGLHPETIYLDQDRYVGAAPRPHGLLGYRSDFYGSPYVSFDPPGYWGSRVHNVAGGEVGLLCCARRSYARRIDHLQRPRPARSQVHRSRKISNLVEQSRSFGENRNEPWGSVMEASDAVFTVGLLVWWAVCGVPERVNAFET